jgi:lipopolysaccharide/colanic/teichoic acid biosynthesis glycosyltransferase
MSTVIDQVSNLVQHPSVNLEGKLPSKVVELIENSIDPTLVNEPTVLETRHAIESINLPSGSTNMIVNKQRLNDIRYMNKFLESVNERLPDGGYFVGCVQTLQQRKDRLYARYSRPFNTLIYCFDFLYKRLWPKLPYLRGAYFALTDGRNRVISEMETYGRLYSCGFRLLDSKEIDGQLYFVAEKTGKPDYNNEATYGPFIILRRVGKNGKSLKVYKLRTMAPYSEYVQQFIYERNGLSGLGDGAKFVDDPRITTLGRFCRRYWIDELPMLYNLLRGDLKIFGVRPISKHYFSLYPEDFQQYRNKFKPGLIPPVYVELPKSLEDTVDIERRYLQAYERSPWRTDISYLFRALYNIFIKRVRSC